MLRMIIITLSVPLFLLVFLECCFSFFPFCRILGDLVEIFSSQGAHVSSCIPLQPGLLLYAIVLCLFDLPLFRLDSLFSHSKPSNLPFFSFSLCFSNTLSPPPDPLLPFHTYMTVLFLLSGMAFIFFLSYWNFNSSIKDQLCEFFVSSNLDLLLFPASITLGLFSFMKLTIVTLYAHIFPTGLWALGRADDILLYLFPSAPNSVLKIK